MNEKPDSNQPAPAAAGPKAAPAREEVVFRPVQARRTFQAVAEQIRLQLSRGQLRPGDRLPSDRELAERFGVSRGGVREAIRSLQAAGLVDVRPGVTGGTFIRHDHSGGLTQTVQDMMSLGRVSIAAMTEARIELMGVAIRLACERITDEELDAIEADIDFHTELFKVGKGSRNTKSVVEFYKLIARATHNEVIVMMVDALSEIIQVLLAQVDPTPRKDIIQVRKRVLAHLRERDAAKAMAAMAQHLRRIGEYLESESRKAAAKRKLDA